MENAKPSEEGLRFALPAVLDVCHGAALKEALAAAGSKGVTLGVDASKVQRVSTLVLQVFAAEAKAAGGERRAFRLEAPSEAFAEAVATLGLNDMLGLGEQTA